MSLNIKTSHTSVDHLGPFLSRHDVASRPVANFVTPYHKNDDKQERGDRDEGHHAENPSGAYGFLPRSDEERDRDAENGAIEIHHRRRFDRILGEAFNLVIDDDWHCDVGGDVQKEVADGRNHVVKVVLQRRTEQAKSDVETDKRGYPECMETVFGTPDASSFLA